MKKLFLSLIAVVTVLSTFAGGIVTNTNQSAAFVRMPAQDAAIGIHAAYHNPAGLTKLADGFHIQLNNQSIFQTKEIESTYSGLNNKTYVGDVKAPLFPSVYAAYKTGKLAFSVGFNAVGGGGGAEYKTGLPSFEQQVAAIPLNLTASGIPTDKYSADVYFEGTSVFWGLQAGISYEINEMISIYGGIRYLMAKNTYNGHIKDMMINPVKDLSATGGPDYTGTMVKASDFFTDLSTASTAGAGQYSGMATALGAADPDANLSNATAIGMLTAVGRYTAGMDNKTAIAYLNGTAVVYTDAATSATYNAAATQDMEVDSEQTGSTIAPILGLHLTLMDDKLNIGMKYEFKAPLEVTNATVVDGSGLFPNKAVVPSEMPALLSVGIDYKIMDNLSLAIGYHQYFDKSAKYGKTDASGTFITTETLLDQNTMEIAVGLEYAVSETFMLSGGWLMTSTGATVAYQTDMGYTLNTNTMAFGARAQISPALAIDLGVMYTFYEDGEKDFVAVAPIPAYKELYRKQTFTAGIGFSYTFGGSGE